MMLEPLVIFELAMLGLFTGFMAGLLGIGGGMIMVPFLIMVLSVRNIPDDLGLKMAIATAMSTIIFTSISSVRAHHQKGAVRWLLVRSLAPGLVLGSMLSSLGVFALIKGPFLGFFFALFVAFSATQMFLDRKPKPTRQLPGPVGLLGAGGFIGFLSGLVGAGGAFVSVPFMAWCNVLIPNAVRSAGLSHCAQQHRGLCVQRMERDPPAHGVLGLCVAARGGDHFRLQRHHSTGWGPCGPPFAC